MKRVWPHLFSMILDQRERERETFLGQYSVVKIKTDKKQKLVGVEIERKRGRERYLGKALDIQRVRQKHNITLHPGWVRPHPHYP